MKSGRKPGFTLDLDEDTAAQLEAFKATYVAKTKRQIISEAIVAHIEEVCRHDKVRERDYLRILAGGTPRRSLKPRSPTN